MANKFDPILGEYRQDDSIDVSNNISIGYQAFQDSVDVYSSIGIGSYALYQAENESGIVAFGYGAGQSTDDCDSTLFLGSNSGQGATRLKNSILIGDSSGVSADCDDGAEFYNVMFIGSNAGSYSHNLYQTMAIGDYACGTASNNISSVYVGNQSGRDSSDASYSAGFGSYSLQNSITAYACAAVGQGALAFSNNANRIIAFGEASGYNSLDATRSTFIGDSAGADSTSISNCTFIGSYAGNSADVLTSALAIGDYALKDSTNAPSSIAIGSAALYGVLNAANSTAIGSGSGGSEFGGGYVTESVFIGSNAGYQAYNASYCIFIGNYAGTNDTVDNYTSSGWNILLGTYTNTGGFQNSIAIGGYVANSAASECNIGNLLFLDGIYTTASQSSTPVEGTVRTISDIKLQSDTKKYFVGAGDDMSIDYDGTQGNIKTNLVTASDLHIDCGEDRTIVLDEVVWCDIDFPIIIRTTGANIPTISTFNGNLTMPQWAVNDYTQCESQEFIHEWKEGSACYWHLHLNTNGSDATDRYVKFELEYAYSAAGAWTFPAAVTTSDILIPSSTTTKTQIIMSLANFTPTGSKIGDHSIARLKRIAASGTAPSNNPWIPMLQMHIQKDTIGSRQMTAK